MNRRELAADFPLRFLLLAAAAVVLQQLLPTQAIASAWLAWIRLAVDLLVIYAGLLLLGWLLLELPTRLWGWRGPSKILRDLLILLIGAAITVVVVQQRGQVNLVGLVTTSAVLTAVIGLAAQETLKDLFAGITLQLDPPFREGDWIDLGEVRGMVTQLTLMNTHLSAMDGGQIVLSNSTVAQETLRRFRPGQAVGTRLSVGLDYSLPPSEALALLRRVLNLHPGVLEAPAPQVWVGAYGASAINYEILAFQRELGDRAAFSLRSDLLEQIWYALERSGQSVPFPVMELRRRSPHPHASSLDFSRAGAQERAELLALNPLLAPLSREQLQQLAPLTRCLRFASGEVIVREGDPGDALFQVVSGRVEVQKHNPGGEPLPVAQLSSGDVFGEMTVCLGELRNATVRATEQTVLLEVERSDLLPLIDSDPELLERIATLVSERRSRLEMVSSSLGASRDSLLLRMRQLFGNLGQHSS
ncbi:MAG: mechanosensitive ion channel [Cyanobacteria bacterium M_surface_7_m2_040]|nr:mechanosensitive ion channel [Cyanobacteria bacterium M_surface_7_m2_040]